MKTIFKYLLSLVCLTILACNAGYANSDHEWPIGPWKFYPSDNPEFKNPGYNDSSWTQVRNRAIPRNPSGVKWIRATLPFEVNTGPLIFSLTDLQSAYEVYWDGYLLARNGTVGVNKKTEVPGTIYFSFLIDGGFLKKGNHLLAIRYSDFHAFSIDNNSIYPSLSIGGTLSSALNVYLLRLIMNFGICFSAFLIGIALFAGGGRFKPYIFFSLVNLPSWVVYGLFILMYTINFPSWFAGVKQLLYFFQANATFAFIGLFFIGYFNMPLKRLLLPVIFCLLIIDLILRWYGIMRLNSWQFYVIIFSIHAIILWILIYGIINKKPGGWIFLAGYVIYLSTSLFDIMGTRLPIYIYDLSLWLFIFVLFFSITIQLRVQTRIQRDLAARAARLESEILKKAIQPHFLMNTLASLQSWSKRDPEKAAMMTQAIAGEYRMINDVVSKALIPIGEELKLCRHHLDLMGYRRDAEYQLIATHTCDEELIPPLVIHTLIENGLTHAMKPKENGTFWFSCHQEKKLTRFILKNNGSLLAENPANTLGNHREGTGFKYVKSRLEEGFPGRWELKYGMMDGVWQVEITLRRNG